MSYQVLARKWRPKSFDTLVGQSHVVRALTHALQQGRLHHAYLFTGTRGVGKTTIARILAKSLNCERGVSPQPCGSCSACQEIDTGRFVDLLEVDAATNTRVDEMRQLLENAVYAPTRGRYKVYVIDEVHMLSNAAFNAMLKTLEEPPEHVKFILATTDPQKIPVTVLSRCLQFNLKQMPQAAIVEHLSAVLAAESVSYDELGLRFIARAANGSMRDALSLLDQAIAHGAGEVREASVAVMLGTLGNDHLFEVMDALAHGEPAVLRAVAEDIDTRALSYDGALASLADLWIRIQAVQLGCVSSDLNDLSDQRYRSLAEKFSPEYVQLAYSITLQGRSQLPLAPDPCAGFLMTLLRLYAFRPERSGEKKKSVANSQRHLAQADSAEAFADRPDDAVPELSINARAPHVSVLEQVPTPIIHTDWREIIDRLNLAGLVRALASHCVLKNLADGHMVLALAVEHRHLLSKSSEEKLQAAVREHLKIHHLRIEVGGVDAETPAQQALRAKEAAQAEAIEAIETDAVVRDLIEVFDATLVQGAIRAAGK